MCRCTSSAACLLLAKTSTLPESLEFNTVQQDELGLLHQCLHKVDADMRTHDIIPVEWILAVCSEKGPTAPICPTANMFCFHSQGP